MVFFEELGWVHSLVMVKEPGFRSIQSKIFPDLGQGSAHFWLNGFEVQAFWRGSNGLKIWFVLMNLGSSEFEV